jgi:hypothetical protein
MTFTEWLQKQIDEATKEADELGSLEDADISEWAEVNTRIDVLYECYGKYMSLN